MGVAQEGKCHICQARKQVIYCDQCGHWFCGDCWSSWYARGLSAIKQLVGGKVDGCCGP